MPERARPTQRERERVPDAVALRPDGAGERVEIRAESLGERTQPIAGVVRDRSSHLGAVETAEESVDRRTGFPEGA